jgi:N-acetylmuramic acid 6-phosphate etherase
MPQAQSPRDRAEKFLEIAGDFRLGDLITEASHPRSATLSQTARHDTADGLAMLFDVDRDVLATYQAWVRSGQPARLAAAAFNALQRGGRLFFTGCGATGRLSIQLDSIWRAFWQARRERGQLVPAPDLWEDRTRSVMAGGDYALIKSVEGFEDFAPFGRKQIADLGLAAGDVVFAITEGGETSFVIGTAWQALETGARVFFVYNNPDDVLREHVRRSREVIDEPRIEKVNLTTGPMAVTGSTRMQATSIQLLAMMTVLEMVARELLATEGALGLEFDASDRVPHTMAASLERLHATIAGSRLRTALASLVEGEERIYRAGARTSYLASALGVDVLTDTTERSPTYCTPSFRKWDDAEAAESWAALFTDTAVTEDAWPALLRRAPQTIEWTQDALRTLLDDDAAERQGAVLREINRHELFRFRIGLDGFTHRPVRAGDGVTAVLTEADLPLVATADATFAALLASARTTGASTSVLGVGSQPFLDRLAAALPAATLVTLPVPDAPFLLDPMTRIGVKMVLNALSTCVMVRLGRVLGNRMICLVPSNLKLIDRSTRYIRDLAEVPYDDACRALFEVIHYVDARRQAGKAYPAPVGVATMQLRYGLDLPAAEARLYEELK